MAECGSYPAIFLAKVKQRTTIKKRKDTIPFKINAVENWKMREMSKEAKLKSLAYLFFDFVLKGGALKEVRKPKSQIQIGTEMAVLSFADDAVVWRDPEKIYKKRQKYWLKKLVLWDKNNDRKTKVYFGCISNKKKKFNNYGSWV